MYLGRLSNQSRAPLHGVAPKHQSKMEALERELALRRIENIFDEIGYERLAHEGDLEEMA